MNSAHCQGGEVEPRLEVVPQDLSLQNSPSAPGELLSHGVKEESDMEPELGEGQLSTVLYVLCGNNLGIVVSRAKCILKLYNGWKV